MNHGSLLQLKVEHLRGSVVPFSFAFEKGKKFTIVYGENGTGKSTLCDALDLLGNGNVGSLDGRGLGPTRRYWQSVGKLPVDVKVILATSSGNCTASLGKKDVVVVPEEQRPRVKVLRRSQILSLVEAKPAERYDAISKFVDVSGMETSEATLRKLILEVSRDLQTAVTRVNENRGEIERFWKAAGSPTADARVWAALELQKDLEEFDRRRDAIDKLIAAWDGLTRYPQKQEQLAGKLKAASEELAAAHAALAEINQAAASDYLEVLDILQAAQRHFLQHPDPEICPLCESREKAAGLAAEVDRRIKAQHLAGKLRASRSQVEAKERAVEQAAQRLRDLEQSARDDVTILGASCKHGDLPVGTALPEFPVPADLAQWQAWLDSHAALVAQWRAASDECVDARKFIATLRASLDALQSNEQLAKDLQDLLPALERTLTVIQEERKKFTDAILAAIATRVGELYEIVHPGEGLNKISLELDPAKRASLEISAEFGGLGNAPPQAYFSDSHLDTLGLCVFLALAVRELPDETILVVDDVLGSVDEPHVDRVIDMLYAQADRFRHCLITTHYGPWRQKYRWGYLKHGQCQFAELTRWSLDKGMTLTKSVPDVEKLRVALGEASPDIQAVCAKAGVVLEAVLDFLTLLYGCRVARRLDGHYTLGDLLPAVDRKLRSALRVEHREEDASGVVSYTVRPLGPHLDKLESIAQARNVFGCHFNTSSFGLPDGDAIMFAQEVLALAEAVIDPEAGWPRSNKSGSYWATSGETRRLHPLQKPS
jgi:energy-coupling factor transporter ATP-binding protein EcfA2